MTTATEVHVLSNRNHIVSSTSPDRQIRLNRGSFTRLMIASDDERALRTLVPALERDGYDVEASRSVVQLLARLRRSATRDPPEILVLDARSRPWASLSALEAIRETDWSLPIVLIHDLHDDETAAAATRLGIDACLPAPLDDDAVRTAVATLAPAVFDDAG